ncbi:uncharacterized protein SPAPADRAFT_55233 [Spathaspora passalidarum NRRL Y-27907]|uniref:Magnesium transporter n=1 Tax=Spathaspora passalidarum (strain NRRL Y-27907 / 11-Y1) TaxID=619300 RepID=G3ALZ4_SPAPN|nr:uncharacterized protein SPAPADRAFT_55233 [Spathaspora passalidarum NRRL Y-27907]EGW33347.1 hypothetical protein SPAPADRAFT_55233 [Spathaspora passalidarum NRRL Y-27907]
MIQSSASSILLGCSVAVISSAIQSLGITLQRKSHLLYTHEQRHTHLNHQQMKYRRNMWLFGFLLFIIANVLGSLIQITTLPLIILSPLQSIGLIFNSILSCLMLPGENFTTKLWTGTFIIAIGAFLIAYNGNVPPLPPPVPPPSADERFQNILHKLLAPSFMYWFIFTFVMMGILLLVNRLYLNSKIARNKATKVKGNLVIRCNKFQFIKGINYGIISGTLTAHTFLFAKSIIDVIVEIILSDRSRLLPVSNSLPVLLLVTMLIIIGLQLTAFNLGLAQISTAILYPLCFLVYNLINLINDLVFNSLLVSHRMTVSQFWWILFGLFAVLCGVVTLSWDSAFGHHEEHVEEMGLLTESLSDNAMHVKKCYSSIGSDSTATGETLFHVGSSQSNEEHMHSHISEQEEDESIAITRNSTVSLERSTRILSFEQNELRKSMGYRDI